MRVKKTKSKNFTSNFPYLQRLAVNRLRISCVSCNNLGSTPVGLPLARTVLDKLVHNRCM